MNGIAAYFDAMVDETPQQNKTRPTIAGSSLNANLSRPIYIGTINWVGLRTLYQREVQRFMKIAMQSIAAPVITSILFLMVFSVAVGERLNFSDNIDFVTFLVPGLVMMSVLQTAFANSSSSLIITS